MGYGKKYCSTEHSVYSVLQSAQLNNPDARIALEEHDSSTLLEVYATAYQGIKTGDDARYRRCFWEFSELGCRWHLYQSTVETSNNYGGLESVIDWSENGRDMARLQGLGAWKKRGVAVSQMGHLPVALYSGNIYDSNVSPVVPRDQSHLPAIWTFCSSPEFYTAVRRIDQALKVTNASLVKVPFDLERWQKVAEEQYPNGLPEPHSDDPTQWLFHGHPARSNSPLQVAVARLLGYHWPQNEEDDLDLFADADGIVCLPPVAGEPPAAQRLRELLVAAYREEWTPDVQAGINTQRDADSRGVAGANARLVAALALQTKLKAILDGEAPYDIYVLWKPLHKQSIGWEPDINDGVRLNVRPFVTTGILRAKFSIHWNKDRGANPDGTERLNDIHLTRTEKEAARQTAT